MTAHWVFPTRLFKPSSLAARIIGASISGGANLTGEAQFADISGGGRWAADFGESALWSRATILAWRRIAAAADSGASMILVPLADRFAQPLTSPHTITDTFGLDTYDPGTTPWAPDQVTATLTANAALGATQVQFSYTAPLALLGGEHFSTLHPTWDWRLYRITRVDSGDATGDGGTTTVDFRPPLREAMSIGDKLNFDSPRCLMRTDGDIDLTVDLQKRAHATAKFVEAGKP